MDDLAEIRKLRAQQYASRKETDMEIDSAPLRTRSRSPRRPAIDEQLRVMSWNVDGLDSDESNEEDLLGRTLWIVKTINECRPHVVMVQELIDFNLAIFKQALGRGFDIYVQKDPALPYFVGIFVHKGTVDVIGSPSNIVFPTSRMGRGALGISVKLKGASSASKYECITAHLESMRESSSERIIQLSVVDSYISTLLQGGIKNIIFGGDLNIRDNEVPKDWKEKDCWILAGKDKAHEYTWDLQLNDNARMPNGGKPRCRFDRMYLFSKNSNSVKSFQLVGKERVEGLDRFPSDHFGVLVSFSPN